MIQMSFIGVTLECRRGITYRSRNDSQTVVLPQLTPAWEVTSKGWKCGMHCTTFRQLDRLENVSYKAQLLSLF